MKGFLKFVVIFAVILLLSAALAPLLYYFFQTFHPYKFGRIFNRLVMIGALVAAVLFVRVKKETFAAYGLAWRGQSFRLLLTGFFSGILTLGAVLALRVFSGQASFGPSAFSGSQWILKFAGALGTGFLIGLMEEFFFRGFIFRSLLKLLKNRVFFSILITTVFYAIIHFIGMKQIFIDSTPTFLDSLRLMGVPFLSLAEWPRFWPQAVGLFLFGLALIGVVYRSGSLYPAIGLHAGCVFFLRLDDSFLKFQDGKSFFWGSKLIYDGIMGWVFVALMGVFLWNICKPSPERASPVSPES